jgi:hypothetical protein
VQICIAGGKIFIPILNFYYISAVIRKLTSGDPCIKAAGSKSILKANYLTQPIIQTNEQTFSHEKPSGKGRAGNTVVFNVVFIFF